MSQFHRDERTERLLGDRECGGRDREYADVEPTKAHSCDGATDNERLRRLG